MSGNSRTFLAMQLALALAGPSGLPAQEVGPREARPGDRIRVTFADTSRRPIVGVLESSGPGIWVVASPRVIHRLAAAEVEAVDVSIQRRSRVGRGLALGLLFGAVGGLGLGVVSSLDVEPCEGWGCPFYCDAACQVWSGLLGGAAVGTVVGLIAGAASRRDVWATARRPEGSAALLHVTPVARPGAESTLLLGARIAW